MQHIVIGIAGGTGSGKTTVALKIYNQFKKKAVILSHDYYYRDNKQMSFEDRSRLNYDHPNSLETELLIQHVKALKEGQSIQHPTYNFSQHLRNEQWQTMHSAPIIIVEGILLFTDDELCNLFDIKLFVDTDADVRFIRRLRRDLNKRGRSVESVVNQYLTTVKPMHEQFVEPSKRKADLIIPEGGNNSIAVATIIDAINRKISGEEN